MSGLGRGAQPGPRRPQPTICITMGKRQYTSAEIYSKLRRRILTERYYPGHKLSENTLAEEFGCSRTPIRENFKKLERDGLLVVRPKSGTYVRNETEQDLIELLQVRAYLESLAFRLAIRGISTREVNRIERLKGEMDTTIRAHPIDTMKYAALHYDFHHAIVKASKNDLLLRTFERLNLRYSHVFYRGMDDSAAHVTQDEHAVILRYLKDRNPEGTDFMVTTLFNRLKRTDG